MFTVKPERGPCRGCTDASRRFARYKKEDASATRETQAKDRVMEQLEKAWKGFRRDDIGDYVYETAVSLVEGIGYGSDDVTKFCLALERFQGERLFGHKAGLFISALVNCGNDGSYHLPLDHLERIDFIGSMNSKDITIEGDVGNDLGNRMKGGEIRLVGNALAMAGSSMEGGRIIIEGDVLGSVGDEMKDGEIIVEGDVRKDEVLASLGFPPGGIGPRMAGGKITIKGYSFCSVGAKMGAGEIHLQKAYEKIGPAFKGGEIYYKGKLIAIG